jgi:hypothetical protein
MSKYFGWIDGKPYDFSYKPYGDKTFTNVYLGTHLICQTTKIKRGSFVVVVQGKLDESIPRLVEGFATRWDAIQYVLKVHPLTTKTYNR